MSFQTPYFSPAAMPPSYYYGPYASYGGAWAFPTAIPSGGLQGASAWSTVAPFSSVPSVLGVPGAQSPAQWPQGVPLSAPAGASSASSGSMADRYTPVAIPRSAPSATHASSLPPLTSIPNDWQSPADFSEAVGGQVGRLVTRALQENPELEARLRETGLDRLLADPERVAQEFRQKTQHSWMAREALRRFGEPLMRALLPQSLEPAGYEALRWLQQPTGGR